MSCFGIFSIRIQAFFIYYPFYITPPQTWYSDYYFILNRSLLELAYAVIINHKLISFFSLVKAFYSIALKDLSL